MNKSTVDLQTTAPDSAKTTPRATRKKKINWKLWTFLIVVGIIAILPYQYEAGGEIIIYSQEQLEIFARAQGEVVDVKVKEGDKVETDQILAKLSDWDLQKAINFSRLELEKKQAKLSLLLDGSKSEEIELATMRRDLA